MMRLMELQCGATGEARPSREDARAAAVEASRRTRDFVRRADWLEERFPDVRLPDVGGLVKLVERGAVESRDRSLTPGRYVGVAPDEEDKNFDLKEALRAVRIDLGGLNEEAAELAALSARNFEVLGT